MKKALLGVTMVGCIVAAHVFGILFAGKVGVTVFFLFVVIAVVIALLIYRPRHTCRPPRVIRFH